MRTLRLLLSGTLAMALLGGLGGAVVAQDEDAAVGLVHVTGTQVEGDLVPGEWAQVGAVGQMRGASTANRSEMSDPRVSGAVTVEVNFDEYPRATPGSSGVVPAWRMRTVRGWATGPACSGRHPMPSAVTPPGTSPDGWSEKRTTRA